MFILAEAGTVIGAAVGTGVIVLTVAGIIIKHTANNDRHPDASQVVYKDVCEKCSDANTTEHKHQSEALSELKVDMRDGFKEIKTLITKQ